MPDVAAQLRPSSWSPDGRKIAFFTYRPADNEIGRKFRIPSHYPLYVMDCRGQQSEETAGFPRQQFRLVSRQPEDVRYLRL